jgi:hypothetical protein
VYFLVPHAHMFAHVTTSNSLFTALSVEQDVLTFAGTEGNLIFLEQLDVPTTLYR